MSSLPLTSAPPAGHGAAASRSVAATPDKASPVAVNYEMPPSARPAAVPTVFDQVKVNRETIEATAEKIQSFASSMKRDLRIYVDGGNRAVIRVVDPVSQELVRQIPPEESIRIAQTIDFLASLLVDQRA
jgi:flagellar protein FlaG